MNGKPPTDGEMQHVYDLIIGLCEHGEHHAAGARALRTIRELHEYAKSVSNEREPGANI